MTKLWFLKSLLNFVLKPKLQLQFDSVHLLKTKPPDYNKCTKNEKNVDKKKVKTDGGYD